ncbi:MAG: hypothetical protein RLZZ455_103 [Candidatus Parcubacteria bacterium]|jgi:dipeptidyl aminopeptidase/acylaminoacyl peptidase
MEQELPPHMVSPAHTQWSRKRIVLSLLVIVFLLCLIVLFLFLTKSGKTIVKQARESLVESISPTPFPYAEMTIPALRNRTYSSSLGELEFLSDNGSYTTYTTSYLSDGLRINGLLTIPTGQQPPGWPDNVQKWPAIVFIHGYIPPSLYVTTEKYGDYIDYLARNGFVVFKIDLRGHGESEGEPGGGYYGADYVTDTLNAYAALQNTSFVDPKRIGLWGHSMAGNIVLRSLAARPTIPAVVIWAGAVYSYVDMAKYGIDDNSYRPPTDATRRLNRRRDLFEKNGSPSAQSAFWRLVAPTNFLTDIKGAIQLNHATDDDVVNIGYSRDLDALLDDTNVPHELHEYTSGGHNITGNSFVSAMENTVRFFKEHLNG